MNNKRFFGIVRRFEGDETLIEGAGELRGYWITAKDLDLGDFYQEHNPREENIDCAIVFAGADKDGYWLGLNANSGLDKVVDVLFSISFPMDAGFFQPKKQRSKLVDAINSGDANLVERLLRAGADPDSVNESGHCAFYAALVTENSAMLRALSAYGPDTSRRDIREHLDYLVAANGHIIDEAIEKLFSIVEQADQQHRLRFGIEEHLRFNQRLRAR